MQKQGTSSILYSTANNGLPEEFTDICTQMKLLPKFISHMHISINVIKIKWALLLHCVPHCEFWWAMCDPQAMGCSSLHKPLSLATIQILYLFKSSKFIYPELCSVPRRSICDVIAYYGCLSSSIIYSTHCFIPEIQDAQITFQRLNSKQECK